MQRLALGSYPRLGWSLLIAVLIAPQFASAQLPQARLNTIFPMGGQKGVPVDITAIGGTDLDDLVGLYFSHPGITAAPKVNMVAGQPPVPVPGQFTVTIAADVPPGLYDVRVRSVFGLSNPRTFVVSDKKEVLEVEPNNEFAKPQVVELNSVINGRADAAADVDYYKFVGKTGQRVLLDCVAQRIDSRMIPAIELYSAAGRKLTWKFGTASDALLDFTLPADGEYVAKVFDTSYGGSAEYFYRLKIHAGPHVDFVIPSSGVPGTTGEFTVYGRNLPGGQPANIKIDVRSGGKPLEMVKVQIPVPADATMLQQTARSQDPDGSGVDAFSYALPGSNPFTLYFASAPTGVEIEPNDAADKAQKIALPLEITGQFQVRGDVDTYQFDAKAGDVYWMEVFGNRNGTAADPVLAVDQVTKNAKGEEQLNRLTILDDNPLNVGGTLFNTTSDDPVFRFAAPTEGTYRVTVRDRNYESRGDPALVYRLALRKETPDFRLVVLAPVPVADPNLQAGQWDLNIRKGDNVQLNVMAFRRDNFTGPIDVTVDGLPPGVTCPGGSIGTTQLSVPLVFSSTEQAADFAGTIKVIGKGKAEDPVAVAALAAAEAARVQAVTALPAAQKASTDAAAAAAKAQEAAVKAKEAAAKDAKNEALKKAQADAEAAAKKAADAAKAAADALAAADKKIVDSNAAVTAARAAIVNTAKPLVREARGATIAWPGNAQAQAAPVARSSRALTLSVLKETAAYQLTTDVTRFEVNQSRQVLVPLKLLKRAGFDADVNLTFVTPPANVTVENKPLPKGKADQVYRIFVPTNVVPGTYTLWQQSQAQVSYSRLPEKLVAATALKDEAAKAALAAIEVQKKATADKTAGDKAATDTAAAAKKAVDDKTAADKKAVDADAAAKKAAEEKVAADKLAVDTAAALKTATDAKTAADKVAIDAEAASKTAAEAAAAAKKASDAAATDKALADAKVAAEKKAAEAVEAAKKATEAKVAADKKLVEATDVAKKATDAKTAADKKVVETADLAKKAAEAKVITDKAAVDTAAAAKKATDAKVVTDKALVDADAALKAANDKKAATEKAVADQTNISKPANLNSFAPGPAITLIVKTGPATLAAAPAGGGNLKRGGNVEVKVTVARVNGFTGPVKLSFPALPGVTGISAPEVVIPADKNEGTLVINAAGDATLGALTNAVIRGGMEFNGPAEVDQPVAITVQ